MKTWKYYWTLAILAILLIFVVACDVAGVVGFFTGSDEEAPVVETTAPAETGMPESDDEQLYPEEETPLTDEGAEAVAPV